MGTTAFRFRTAGCLVVLALALTGCRAGGNEATAGDSSPILLFNGTGVSPGDVAALQNILHAEHLTYSMADSQRLNRMTDSQLRGYRLLIVPGGNFEQLGGSLSSDTAAKIRNAIHDGLNYLGICAGAFFAGNSPYNGLNLTSGVRFDFYSAEAKGIRKAAVAITAPGGQTLDQYWEDGPQLTGWGVVAGTYPNGTPAIAEGTFGKGWVILTGVHPEAPQSWRRGMDFHTPASVDNAYAAALIRAALNREQLPAH
ncbi:MAG: BPL-N domain-containing protein [Bryobacteraceae bacterium]